MRRRPSSRILLLDRDNRILLFRFQHRHGGRAGQSFWATPGGALESGESPAEAAHRELFEEVGIRTDAIDGPLPGREFTLDLPDGEKVIAEEYFFTARVSDSTFCCARQASWTAEGIVGYRWWSAEELTATNDVIFPENIAELLAMAGLPGRGL